MTALSILMLGAALVDVGPATAAASCAAGAPCVIVHVIGEQPAEQAFSLSQIANLTDVTNQDYDIKSTPGSAPQTQRIGSGVSIAGLLADLNTPLPPGAVTGLGVTRRDGTTSTLQSGDLASPAPFDRDLVPVVYVVGSNDAVGYLRPLRGAGDANGDDFFQTFSGDSLDIYAYTSGKPINVRISASPASPKANAPVQFTAVTDAPRGARLTYDWFFGDRLAPVRASASPTHRYKARGTYRAYAIVHPAQGPPAQSTKIFVAVNPANPGGGNGPGTGSSDDPNAPTSGPDSSKGNKAGGTPSPTANRGAAGQSGSDAGTAKPSESRSAPDGGTLITGVVISADGESSKAIKLSTLQRQASAATAPSARRGQSDRLQLPLGALAAVLLLTIGAFSESRWRPTRRTGTRTSR